MIFYVLGCLIIVILSTTKTEQQHSPIYHLAGKWSR